MFLQKGVSLFSGCVFFYNWGIPHVISSYVVNAMHGQT